MRWIMLTFKNIGKFIHFHPVLFIFLIFAQVVCCIAVFISCGMAYNMEYVEKPGIEGQYFCYNFNRDDPHGHTMENFFDENGEHIGFRYIDKNDETIEFIDFPDAIPFPEFRQMMDEAFAAANNSQLDYVHILLVRGIREDVRTDFTIYFNSYYPEVKYNPMYLTEDQIKTDEKIFFAVTRESTGKHSDHCNYYVGRKYEFGGTEYECVGEAGFDFFPYNAVPNEFAVDQVWFNYDGTLTEDQIIMIKEKLDAIFGDRTWDVYVPEAYDPIEIQYSKMLFIVSIVVILIILLALSKFYKFILSDRKDMLSVLRLCGCTMGKAQMIYMLEIFLTMAATTGLGFLLYKYVFHSPIAQMYPAFEEFYITPVYLAVMGAYFAAAMVIMAVTVIPATKTTIGR